MKRLARLLFLPLAILELIRFRLTSALIGGERAFTGLSERLARRPGFVGVYLRAATYRLVLECSARDVHIGFGTIFSKPTARVGDHVYIGRYCSLGWVHLGPNVMLADLVTIPSGADTHVVDATARVAPRHRANQFRRVTIGEGTWVGSQAVLLADVGQFCVIGAGAVVTRPIPDHAIAVGVPARIVGSTIRADDSAARAISGTESAPGTRAGDRAQADPSAPE
jgi:acetyltransferase-like isoleucine patch superfamily enzyme